MVRSTLAPRFEAATNLTRYTGGHRRIHKSAEAHALLAQQVEDQLQERILQELGLLLDKLKALPKVVRYGSSAETVRILAEPEYEHLRNEQIAPDDKDSLAIIAFPELPDVASSSKDSRENAPFAVLASSGVPAPSSKSPRPVPLQLNSHELLPSPLVPIYQADRLFPSSENARRSSLLTRLEKLARLQSTPQNPLPVTRQGADSPHTPPLVDSSSGHAYLIRNPHGLVACGVDAAPLAIALWRMRLWNGEGWRSTPSIDES